MQTVFKGLKVLVLIGFLGLSPGLRAEPVLPFPSVGSFARYSVERYRQATGELQEQGEMRMEVVSLNNSTGHYTVSNTYTPKNGTATVSLSEQSLEQLHTFKDMQIVVQHCDLYGGTALDLLLPDSSKFSTCKVDFEDASTKATTWYGVASFGVVQQTNIMKDLDKRFETKLIDWR